jgi:hypothetical protein
MLPPYNKARHTAQVGTGAKVIHQILNELESSVVFGRFITMTSHAECW